MAAAILLAVGCGSYFSPSSTARPVSAADLAGIWAYEPLAGGPAVRLELRGDNTFQQTVRLPTGPAIAEGRWRVADAKVRLDAVRGELNDWETPSPAAWRIIDRDESPTGFAIFGGAEDPDHWVVFRWESEAP